MIPRSRVAWAALIACGLGLAVLLPVTGSHDTFLELLNQARIDAGREPLRSEPRLDEMAAERARRSVRLGRLERPDLDRLIRRLDRRGFGVRSLEEASVVTSGPPVEPAQVLSVWRRHAEDSFVRFLSEDVTDFGMAHASHDGQTVYTFLGALPETRVFARTIETLGDPKDVLRELVRQVNEARGRADVPPLELDSRLVEAAQRRADDMAERQYYGHTTPQGEDFSREVERAEYPFSVLAENIARGQESVHQVVEEWLESPGHRANLLHPAFTDVGFGFAPGEPGGDFVLLWVQILGRPTPPKPP